MPLQLAFQGERGDRERPAIQGLALPAGPESGVFSLGCVVGGLMLAVERAAPSELPLTDYPEDLCVLRVLTDIKGHGVGLPPRMLLGRRLHRFLPIRGNPR